MGEQKSQKSGPPPWHIAARLENLPETAQHFDLVPDAAVRAAVAGVANLRNLPRLAASFDVTRRGADGLHVSGSVSATVGQTCVVTLEPLVNEIDETVDLTFVPRPAAEADAEPRDVKWDDPEPLIEGKVDLGALA